MRCDLEAEYGAEVCDQAADQPQIARCEIGQIQFADAAAEGWLGAGRIRGGVEQLDELRMNVGRRGRIVDGEEIDALPAIAVERDHQAEKVRIGLQMRAAETG